MLALLAAMGYALFALSTAALVWAAQELFRVSESARQWQPGANPHAWRF